MSVDSFEFDRGHAAESLSAAVSVVASLDPGDDRDGSQVHPRYGSWCSSAEFAMGRRAPSLAATATRISKAIPAMDATVIPIPYDIASSPELASK